MDSITKSAKKIFSNDKSIDQDDDFRSDATSTNDNIDYNDILGNPEVETKSNDVTKGRNYLLFTIFMCLFLSLMVIQNGNKITQGEKDDSD